MFLEPDVHHAQTPELGRQQLLYLRVGGRTGDSAPPLVARVAALARNGGQFVDVRFEVLAIDPAVGESGRRHRPLQVGLFERHDRRREKLARRGRDRRGPGRRLLRDDPDGHRHCREDDGSHRAVADGTHRWPRRHM